MPRHQMERAMTSPTVSHLVHSEDPEAERGTAQYGSGYTICAHGAGGGICIIYRGDCRVRHAAKML